jgi:hypothetical protein
MATYIHGVAEATKLTFFYLWSNVGLFFFFLWAAFFVCLNFSLSSAQYTFFSAAHGTFSKIDHTRGHKTSLSKYTKIETIPCILCDNNALKLELSNKNNSRKYT